MRDIRLFLVLMFFVSTLTSPSIAQWVHISRPGGGRTYSFAGSDTNLYAGTDDAVFLSTDGGTNWKIVNAGLPTTAVKALASNGADLVATSGQWVFISTNGGISWSAAGDGLTTDAVYALAIRDTSFFVGGYGGVFRSTNLGRSWTAVNVGMTSRFVYSLAIGDGGTFAGTIDGMFRSTNNGSDWSVSNSGLIGIIDAVTICNGVVFAGPRNQGIFRSTNNGIDWTSVRTDAPTGSAVLAFAVSEQKLVALLSNTSGNYPVNTLCVSTDGGATWKSSTLPPTMTNVYAFSFSNSNLLAGTIDGVWRRPLAEIVLEVKEEGNSVAARFTLEQNYPNPFNPVTTIHFSLASTSFVSLKVFDPLGREVSLVLAEQLTAGTYGRQWNAAALPSGVYFYRLVANTILSGQPESFTETKKLTLLR